MFLASFVEKNIFDLEISGGHFVFALKKFRPRVPKWHPADFCSGHPIVSKSIIIRPTYFYPANTWHALNAVSMLGQR